LGFFYEAVHGVTLLSYPVKPVHFCLPPQYVRSLLEAVYLVRSSETSNVPCI